MLSMFDELKEEVLYKKNKIEQVSGAFKNTHRETAP